MDRRTFLPAILSALPAFSQPAKTSLRGKLVQEAGQRPALEVARGKRIQLEGDQPTAGVLNDRRLAGMELELTGKFSAPDLFAVDPIHTKAMFVRKNGKRFFITYWCEVCAIRAYTPGKCRCCHQETELDLRESDQP